MAVNIIKNTSYHNTSYAKGRAIKYIVIHYTGNTSSRVGTAWNNAEWFKSPNAGGSADYIVDDGTMVQYNPNIADYYCWAVGGSKYGILTTSLGATHYNKAVNKNCVSIEMVSNKINKSNLLDTADDWYFTEETVNNAVELTRWLMQKYNIPIENVIMHHQVTGKHCPAMWTRNESALKGWYNFIAKVKNEITPTPQPDVIDTTCKVAINGRIAEYKSKNVKGHNYIAARAFLEALGYTVGFNDIKKRVMVDNRLTLDIATILEDGFAYIHLRGTIDFLNQYDTFRFIQDKTIRYDENTKVIVIS